MKQSDIQVLISSEAYDLYLHLVRFVETHYEMESTLKDVTSKTRPWIIEHKFARSKKTLTGFYFYDQVAGIQIILGKKEQATFLEHRSQFPTLTPLFDQSKTYHDGKWIMIPLDGSVDLFEIEQLLLIKRRPHTKRT